MMQFNYHSPKSLDEAVQLMQKAEDGAFMSGGHTLVPSMRQMLSQPSDIIDLKGLNLGGIKISGTKVSIGAGTTHAEVAADKALAKACAGICKLAAGIGDPLVRHMGTIGGSIANNDPAADYPAAVLGLGANVVTSKRTLSADKFFVDLFETALDADEIVLAVEFETPKRSGYAKFEQPASRFALTGAFVAELADGEIRVAIVGAGENGVFRCKELETGLKSRWGKESVMSESISSTELMSDIHADAGYRAHLIKVMTAQAAQEAG